MIITLDGEPISQTRMKFSSRGGFGRIYDPREKQKTAIKAIIRQKFAGFDSFIHPRISFIFHLPVLKSLSKKEKERLSSGMIKHEKKPDVDNFLKLYLDCLDGIAFDGDQKVSLGPCLKLYHPEPKTIIFIEESSQEVSYADMTMQMYRHLFSSESDVLHYAGKGDLPDLGRPLVVTTWQPPDTSYQPQLIATSSPR